MVEAEAVIDGDRRMTYAGLEAASDRVAAAIIHRKATRQWLGSCFRW